MDEPVEIENLYFDWLCAKVKTDVTAGYLELFRIMHSHEFIAINGSDENRIEDAREFRELFLMEFQLDGTSWLGENCSVFEILIAFSERAAFQIPISPKDWFWQFVSNLGLENYSRASFKDRDDIHDILNRFVMREYKPNGDGGLFPLRRPKHDQREVEIWYQFCEYVEDNGLLYELI